MQKRSLAVLGASVTIAVILLPGRNAWPAPEPQIHPEGSQPAYASSLPVVLRPRVERASFHLRLPELQALYQAVAEAYGVRLLYDRDLQRPGVASNFDLENATLQEALDAAGSISSTFVAPLDEHTGIVAADTPQKRGEFERQVLTTLHADSQTTPQQLTEITTALRSLLDLRRVSQDTRSKWISILGRTRQVATAERFFQTLQKPAGEVLLDIEVWEINSRRARELGILPPQPFGLRFLGLPQLVQQLLSQAQTSTGLSGFTFGKGRTLYGVTIPAATAQANLLSSVVRSHQSLQLRASQGQQASLLIGVRFPLVTATLASSFTAQDAQQQGGSLANFPTIQYEDLGVDAKVTPYFHAGQEVTLQLDLAIRDLGSRDANNMPTIVNRQITGQIRLKEGESYLITGLRNNTEQQSRSGYPWFVRMPLLGPLFGLWRNQKEQSEFWLLVRPHILRSSPAEEFASRTIYFGKELTGLPSAPQPTPVTPAPAQVPPQPGGPPQPGVLPQPGVPPAVPVIPTPQPEIIPQQTPPLEGVTPPEIAPQSTPEPEEEQAEPPSELP